MNLPERIAEVLIEHFLGPPFTKLAKPRPKEIKNDLGWLDDRYRQIKRNNPEGFTGAMKQSAQEWIEMVLSDSKSFNNTTKGE
jgi:hypothetical protein